MEISIRLLECSNGVLVDIDGNKDAKFMIEMSGGSYAEPKIIRPINGMEGLEVHIGYLLDSIARFALMVPENLKIPKRRR